MRPAPPGCRLGSGGASHDPQAQGRTLPAVLEEDRSEDEEAPEPRHVLVTSRRREAREGGAVLQAKGFMNSACGGFASPVHGFLAGVWRRVAGSRQWPSRAVDMCTVRDGPRDFRTLRDAPNTA